MAIWTLGEYDRLFRGFPPTSPNAPHGDDLAGMARELRRSTGAVAAQWNDARSAVLHSKTAASGQLMAYLARPEWLERKMGAMERGHLARPTKPPDEFDPKAVLTVRVAGRPAPFATAGERPWKDLIAAQMPGPSGHPASGLVVDFSLPHPRSWPAHPDIDNLCEPVFATVVNRLGWYGGSRPNLGWYVATKHPGPEPGATISIKAGQAPDAIALVTNPVFAATWPGPLPRSAREDDFVTWVREKGLTLGTGPIAVALEFGGPRVNIGDVATGPVKSTIDCLQPIIGGPFGNPDDHRVVLLLVSKGVEGVPVGAVRVTVGLHAQLSRM